jgi:hypothetical protein
MAMVDVVLQAVRRLILDRRTGRFFQAGLKAAALDHEIGDHAVENSAA